MPKQTRSASLPKEEAKPKTRKPAFSDPLQTLGLKACVEAIIGSAELRTLAAQFKISEDEFLTDFVGGITTFVARMEPRDNLRRLALVHLVLHHARTITLARVAAVQFKPDAIKVLNDARDGASGSFRRLLDVYLSYR